MKFNNFYLFIFIILPFDWFENTIFKLYSSQFLHVDSSSTIEFLFPEIKCDYANNNKNGKMGNMIEMPKFKL